MGGVRQWGWPGLPLRCLGVPRPLALPTAPLAIPLPARRSFNFLEIVELLNCVYCMGELLEFAAFIWLRVK